MSDRFRPLSLEHLVGWIADELAAKSSIFGIPRALFFTPSAHDRFRAKVYGHPLETPIGVAAGPHSQLAQNIVVAWLCGARFIELKTVQTLDRIEVSKPCIDMQDEGYNVEWSQELLVEESFHEYLNAWVLIHALHHHLGHPGPDPGVIFNLSVGYDLKGLHQPNMRWFLDCVEDPSEDFERCLETVARRFPEARTAPVPPRMSDNVTLSTMHGCPPEEIGAIVTHLLEDRGLHTSVKLNPTLLGAAKVREILGQHLGYLDVTVPDRAFSEDLAYPDAVAMLRELKAAATRHGLVFGVKLTNTLAVENHRRVFAPGEHTMYLSGRPLHALTVQLADRLATDVGRPLLMSFSGGADAMNVGSLLRAGMRTVTVCSDLLRPGGYLRLRQYLENIDSEMEHAGVTKLDDFILAGAGGSASSIDEAAEHNLRRYAEEVLENPAFRKETYDRSHTKTTRRLGLFDCVRAPCTDACDVDQKVPDYMRRVRDGDLQAAAAVTREDNPLASILGRTCHHPCEPVCLRTHMDQPLAIREIKRFITEHEKRAAGPAALDPGQAGIAVVGGGPCGLAAATFLARAGHRVVIFEARPASGGMVSATIPDYRAAGRAVEQDLEHIRALGVEVRHRQEMGRDFSLASLRDQGFRHVVIAVGARLGLGLGIEGEGSVGVLDGLDFLRAARSGKPPMLGARIGVIGGGDVAMDCARTALRLSDGRVDVFYRRTRAQMPAQKEEVRDLLREGGGLTELVAPRRILSSDGRLDAVEMVRMRLGDRDDSGRRRPEEIPGSGFEEALDTLIVAIGQRPDLGLFGSSEVSLSPSGYLAVEPETLETSLPGVFAGGDIIGDGPDSIVKACGDGRRIAAAIDAREQGISDPVSSAQAPWPDFDVVDLLYRRSRQEPRVPIPHRPFSGRSDFAEVVLTLTPDVAAHEASRCLDCDLMCSTCDGVCPNRAILTYQSRPGVLRIPRLRASGDEISADGNTEIRIEQGPQVAVLTDLCNECGNCVTFCPTADRPWRDKPRLFLNRGDFESEQENAFMLLTHRGMRGLQARFGSELHELFHDGLHFRYSSPAIRLVLDSDTLAVCEAAVGPAPKEEELVAAPHLAAMVTILRSMTETVPELPPIEADSSWLL